MSRIILVMVGRTRPGEWLLGGSRELEVYGQPPGTVSARTDAVASITRISAATMDATDVRIRRSTMGTLLEVRHGRAMTHPHSERVSDPGPEINNY
jgi:hypothetical protein